MSGSKPRPPSRHPRHATALVCAGVLLAVAPSALAQLAPVGAHHLGIGPAAAHSPVSPTGAFSTAVPLDLPAGRGGIPLPLSVVYTGNPRVGAAGAGWDIPLSFVRVSRSTMRRKPSDDASFGWGPDRAPTRVVMTIGGAMQYMVPAAQAHTYRPQTAQSYSELTFDPSTSRWTYDTADGLRYVFVPASTADTDGGAHNTDPDWYLLAEIRRLDGRDRVVLDYEVSDGATRAPEVNLVGLRYTFRADGTRPLYEVRLSYVPCASEPTGCTPRLLAHTWDSGYATSRSRTLHRIEVYTDDNHGIVSRKVTRSYSFTYAGDADTMSPRLTSVETSGEVGFPGSAKSLPVARYQYGAASTGGDRPVVRFAPPIAHQVGTAAHRATAVSTSSTDRDHWGFETTSLTSMMHDFTGDGLPDYLYRTEESGRLVWHLVRNQPAGAQRFQVTPENPVITWTVPSELSVQKTTPPQLPGQPPPGPPPPPPPANVPAPPPGPRAAPGKTDTWVSFMDWNGDGRPDVIDARSPDEWVIHINEGVVGTELRWRQVSLDVQDIVAHLVAHDHIARDWLDSPIRVPLERSESYPWLISLACQTSWYSWRQEGFDDHADGRVWVPTLEENTDCNFPWPGLPRPDFRAPMVSSQYELDHYRETPPQQTTIKVWGFIDANGDKFQDFFVSDRQIIREQTETGGDVDERGECVGPGRRELPPLTVPGMRPHPNPGQNEAPFESPFRCANLYQASMQAPSSATGDVTYLNTAGSRLESNGSLFSTSPLDPAPSVSERWVNGESPLDPASFLAGYLSRVPATRTGPIDANGDGLELDRFDGFVKLEFETDRHERCDEDAPPDTSYHTYQTRGLADINGDGLPDLVDGGIVQFGNGVWFGAPLHATYGLTNEDPNLNVSLSPSVSTGTCGGTSQTTGGLLDIDGDGRAEVVRFDGGVMMVSTLMAPDSYPDIRGSDSQGAGRLIGIDNGYGAITRLNYDNNKLDTRTRHEVPVPEVVLAKTYVEILPGFVGTPIGSTYYTYGDARIEYDPIWGTRDFVGYDRTVALSGLGIRVGEDVQLAGTATITDRRRRWSEPITVPDLLPSFRSRMLRNLPHRTTMLTGTFDLDPRALLTIDVATDNRVTGAQEVEHEILELDGAPTGWDPWIIASGLAAECSSGWGDSGYCLRAGIIYTKRTTAWQGHEPLPSRRNVATTASVSEVDPFGRATRVIDHGDSRSTEDDRCTSTVYAAPPSGFPAFYSLVDSVTVDECGASQDSHPDRPPVTPLTLAATHFTYDELGRMTSSIVDRYDVGSGLYLGSFVSQRVSEYDALGSARRIERPRGSGTPATQITTIAYDRYSLTPKETVVSSTDQGTSFRTQSTVNTLREQRTYWVFPTGATMIRYRDEFSRPTGEIVMPVGGTGNYRKLSTTMYDDTATQRSVTVVTYPGTAVDNAAIGAEQMQRTYLDALGRPFAVQSSLGADYGREWMAQATLYDLLGRVAYSSTPQRTTAAPYIPADNALPYGTTYFYGDDGDLLGTMTGPGRADELGYSYPAGDVFATRTSKYFANGARYDRAYGPKDLDPMSDTFADYSETRSTAGGWALETMRGGISSLAVFDRVEHFYDRFGRESRTVRHGDALDTTEWRTRYDSLGNVLHRTEQGRSTVYHSYDEWGGLLQSDWSDDAGQHYAKWTYDGLGRPTEYRLEKQPPRDPLEREWTQFYYYDEHSDSPHQPQSPSLLGRLSWIHVPNVGSEFYGYDGLQQGVSTTTLHADDGVPYRTSQRLSVGGRLDALTFDIPGRTESVTYTYDSAERMRRAALSAGGTTSELFTANQFDDLGRYRDLTFGNGVRELFDYSPTGLQQLKSWSVVAPASTYQRIIDSRDTDGRITALREATSALPGDETAFAYTYDRLGRLTHSRATGRENRDESFAYDSFGNLLPGTDVEIDYAYNDTHDKDRLTAVGHRGSVLQPLQYDGAGNVKMYTPVGKPAVALTYDTASRVTSLTSANGDQARFTYGPGGSLFREHVVTASGETDVRHYADLIERRTRPDDKTHVELRVPGPLGTLVSLRREGTTKNDYRTVTAEAALYPHDDHQGTHLITDEGGNAVQFVGYRSYGALTSPRPGHSLHDTDELWNYGTHYETFGVVMVGARVYDPAIGRFLQSDPVKTLDSASAANPYAFSWGDPVNLSDPTGLSPAIPLGPLATVLDAIGAIDTSDPVERVVRRGLFDMEVEFAYYHEGVEISWEKAVRLLGRRPVTELAYVYGEHDVLSIFDFELKDGSVLTRTTKFSLPQDARTRERALQFLHIEDDFLSGGASPIGGGGLWDRGVRTSGMRRGGAGGGRGGGRPLIRPRDPSDPSTRSARLPRDWAPVDINDSVCDHGCEVIAQQIQGHVGGKIVTITPRITGTPYLGPFRGRDTLRWESHTVVLKKGRVFDLTTGSVGLPIMEYKQLWKYPEAINFGF